MNRRRYIGQIAHLRGPMADVRPRTGNAGQVMAQFEAAYLREAREWWQFAETDFDAVAAAHESGSQGR